MTSIRPKGLNPNSGEFGYRLRLMDEKQTKSVIIIVSIIILLVSYPKFTLDPECSPEPFTSFKGKLREGTEGFHSKDWRLSIVDCRLKSRGGASLPALNHQSSIQRSSIINHQSSIINPRLSAASAAQAGQMLDIPMGDELYREVYDFVDRMVIHGYVTRVFKNTKPYSHGEVAQILCDLEQKVKEGSLRLSEVEKDRLRQLLANLQVIEPSAESNKAHLFQTQGEKHKFGFDFGVGESTISRKREADERLTGYAILFRPTVIGQIRDDFAFYSDLKVYYLSATQFPDIPKTEVRMSQPAKETKTASLSNYYIKAKLPWFSILFGHDNLHWGPGHRGALLVSEHPLPMNMLKLQAQYYPVNFQAVTARLGSNIDKKYLSGHRLELNLWDKCAVGIAETVVYGHRFETVYLNPVQIYTTTEFVFPEAVGENDNVLISGDFDLIPFASLKAGSLRNLELYGEVMIDDYRPFSYSPKNWGNKFGLLFGGYWVDPFLLKDTDLRLEYAFVNQYAYTHSNKINAYTHFNSPIGHQIGTDADDIWLNLKHWFTPNFTVSLSYELERHGGGNVNKPHPPGAPDDDEWEFLSGVTESTHSIGLGASYNLIGNYSATLEYTHSWNKNEINQNGVNENNNQVLLSGQYRF